MDRDDNFQSPHIDIDDNSDEYEKALEAEMEKSTNVYIDKLDLIEDKSDDELLMMTKEEIIQYNKVKITVTSADGADIAMRPSGGFAAVFREI